MSAPVNQLKDAKFGAAAFRASQGGVLPSVFPREMGPNAHKYVAEVIDGGLQSTIVDRMEAMIAEAHGRKHCVGAPGCTQALFTTMMAMDFEPGDEIVVSPISDYGTVAGALFENYIPVFADTEPGTGLISAETILPCITERTRAILVVHKFGLTPDMDPIIALAKKHKLVLIEDVCQAILATYKGRIAGSMGDVACFSFDAEKTCGADIGGATVTDDEAIYSRLVNRGPSRGAKDVPGFGRVHIFRGFPTRIPQCTAATVMANFEILPRQIRQRQKTAAMLTAMLAEMPGIIPYSVPQGRTHSYWMYGFTLELEQFRCNIDEFCKQLSQEGLSGVGPARYYLLPESLWFVKENAQKGRYPFCTPPASRIPVYSAASTPNAQRFLDRWVRWFWTEKYTEKHVEMMANMVRTVVERNHR